MLHLEETFAIICYNHLILYMRKLLLSARASTQSIAIHTLMPTWERNLYASVLNSGMRETLLSLPSSRVYHTFITCNTFCFICMGCQLLRKQENKVRSRIRMQMRRREFRPLLLQLPQQHVCCFFKGLFWTDKAVTPPTEDMKEMILATNFSHLKYSPTTLFQSKFPSWFQNILY